MKNTVVISYLIVIIMLLVSCSNNIQTKACKLEAPYVVVDISYFDKNICKYRINTGVDYTYYIDNLNIIDSVGKYSIGDTVFITLNKNTHIGNTNVIETNKSK